MFYTEKEGFWMAKFLMGCSLVMISVSVWSLIEQKCWALEWQFYFSSSVEMEFILYFDWISCMFFSFVSFISSSIMLYSCSYMTGDKSERSFMFLVFMFVVSMFFMVFSLNLVSLMLGWDGLGIVSYILVIYYMNEKSSAAGMITALSNRVGDAALMLSIACFLEMGSWDFMMMNMESLSVLGILISVAAITKSAQIPFSAWLPAAMAAPTPVSALVHSSTLVTAGIYLLIRFSSFLLSSSWFFSFMYLGMITTFMASLSALFEVDMKKVIALSTLSQLGIMLMILAMGYPELAFIHLLTHAVFKALLFMCSGKIIHSVGSTQDSRAMGGLFTNLPLTNIMMNSASFALCGLPFLAGFYSKDLLIEMSLINDSFLMKYIMYTFLVGLSASYSFRLIYLSVVKENNQASFCSSDEEDWIMVSSKLGLLGMSMISGALLIWLVVPAPYVLSLTMGLKWLAFLSMLMGYFLGVMLCFYSSKSSYLTSYVFLLESFMSMWFLPKLSGSKLTIPSVKIVTYFKALELGWLEKYGGQGVFLIGKSEGVLMSNWQLNSVKKFMLVLIVGTIFIWVM